MKKIIFLFGIILSTQLMAQSEASEPFIIDTAEVNDREVVMYSNNTWQYLEDLSFDGILNPHLNYLIHGDTAVKIKTYWDNNMCFSNQNNAYLKTMQDTFWLCLTDSLHPSYAFPVKGKLTSAFKYRGGRWHHGVDLDLNTGDTVVAAFAGKVRYAKYNTHGYGNLVIIRHFNGLETYYAHLSELLVSPNQYVAAGQTIGLGGATGRAYGAHLHFETRFFDSSIDPEQIFNFDSLCLNNCNLLVHRGMFKHTKAYGKDKYLAMRTAKAGQNYPNGRYHRVRSGDSLWKISRLYNTTVSKLCRLNGITESTTLQIGQRLKVG